MSGLLLPLIIVDCKGRTNDVRSETHFRKYANELAVLMKSSVDHNNGGGKTFTPYDFEPLGLLPGICRTEVSLS